MKRIVFLATCALLALVLVNCSEKLESPLAPEVIHDTTYIVIPPDTIFDTTIIGPDTIVDSLYFPPDTIIRTDTIRLIDTVSFIDTLIDTVSVPAENLVFANCKYWKLKDGQMSVELQLENPAGTYLIGFERIRLTNDIPEALNIIVDFGNGQVFQKSVYGERRFIDWSGPVDLPEDARVTISLDEPWFAGKITGTNCREYFKGFWWFGVRAPDNN